MTYKNLPNISSDMPNQVVKLFDDGLCITINLNAESPLKDEYLAWLAEGNEPLPPD